MDSIPFNSSTHRIVIYKGKPVALPLLTYWKLSDLKADDTVVIQQTSFEIPGDLRILALPETGGAMQYQRVKRSELSELGE